MTGCTGNTRLLIPKTRWIKAVMCAVLVVSVWVGAPALAASADRETERVTQATDFALGFEAHFKPKHVQGRVFTLFEPSATSTWRFGVGFDGQMGSSDQFQTAVEALSYTHSIQDGRYWLRVGKDSLRVGRGRLDTLVASGDLPGYPSIAYGVEGVFLGRPLRYVKVTGDLGTADWEYKRLNLHRVEYELTPTVHIGFGEWKMRSEPFPGDVFYDIMPLPLYLSKYVPGASSTIDNNAVFIDAEVDLGTSKVYGELLIDEYPAVPGVSKNPLLYGLLLGVTHGDLVAEYVRITNYVYTNSRPGTAYVYDDKPLGHSLGNDGERIEARWTTDLSQEWQMSVGAFAQRKGEGEVSEYGWYSDRAEFEANRFLSGVVETMVGLSLELTHFAPGWEASGYIKAGPVTNEGHVKGESGVFYELGAGLVVSRF